MDIYATGVYSNDSILYDYTGRQINYHLKQEMMHSL